MKKPPVRCEAFYHLYNHAISTENLFRNDDNYDYFIGKYLDYISPIAKTLAYCLMPNHFHFAVQIKEEKKVMGFFKIYKNTDLSDFENLTGLLSFKINKQFSNFFNAYAKAFNKVYNRRGKLFMNSMHLKVVNDGEYLKKLVRYIHLNPVIHGFTADPGEWKYSSYNFFNSPPKILCDYDGVIGLFDDEVNFKSSHKVAADMKGEKRLEEEFL